MEAETHDEEPPSVSCSAVPLLAYFLTASNRPRPQDAAPPPRCAAQGCGARRLRPDLGLHQEGQRDLVAAARLHSAGPSSGMRRSWACPPVSSSDSLEAGSLLARLERHGDLVVVRDLNYARSDDGRRRETADAEVTRRRGTRIPGAPDPTPVSRTADRRCTQHAADVTRDRRISGCCGTAGRHSADRCDAGILQ